MDLGVPLNIHWEITNECNFHCIQCYQQNDERHTRLTDSQIIAVAHDIVNCGVFQVSLSGGEPFLVPVLYDIIRLLKTNNIDVIVCSNGSYITKQDVKELAELKVPVQISLDSHNKEKNNYIRGHERAFDLAITAIDQLVASGIDTSVAFCASKFNYMDLAGVVGLCVHHGVKKVVVGEMLPVRGEMNQDKLLSPKDYETFLADAKSIIQDNREIIVSINTNWGFLIDPFFDHAPCTALDRDFAILYNGYVTPCPFIRNPMYYLGNVLNQGIRDIWKESRKSDFYKYKFCGCDQSCDDYYRCMSGCKAEFANRGLPLNGKDLRCIK